MLKILIIGINFYPELTGIGKYTAELAFYLSAARNEVRVVTAPPYYPYWKVQPGYTAAQYQRNVLQGLKIYRCPLWVPRKPSGAKRLLHLLSFALSSFPALLGQLAWKPDVVLCIAPAFFCAPFALFTARLTGAKAWLHIQDFELDAAASLEILPANHFLVRWAVRVEQWLMARFDRVSTISRRMMVRLEQKGLPPEHTYLFPNWVDTQAIFPLPDSKDSLRHELDISEEKIIVLYSGTMGAKQGLEIMIHTAQLLQDKKNILFVFCGEGAARADLMNATRNFSNVKHLPLQPLEKLNLLLNTADIHIMPQKANVADLVMPSKLLGMLASGRAIVATADRNTELGQIISRVGVLISPHNTAELADVICKLADSPDQRARLGASARNYVCERWSAELVLPRFHEQLTHLTKKSR